VLARLEAVSGVDHAAVDYHGDLLKMALRHEGALGPATTLLAELGYRAEIATEADARAVDAWYDTGSVGDLSRVEAGVIADRIVPPFARAQSLSASRSELVHAAVIAALHECFVSHTLGSGPSVAAFRSSCERAVDERLRPILGNAAAAAIARLLSIDMSEDHRSR
jgi:hypothetical protein